MILDATLVQLETAQLVRHVAEEEPAYIFKHVLTQDAAYQSLLLKQRRALHTLVAQTIETLYPDQLDEYFAILARHYANAGDDPKSCAYSIYAGDVAMRLSALVEARWHFNNALEILTRLPNDPANQARRLTTLIKLANASAFAEDPARNVERLVQAEALATSLSEAQPGFRQQLAQVYYWRGFICLMQNQTRATIRFYRQAQILAQEIHDEPLAAQTAFDTGVVLNVQGRFGEAEPMIAASIVLMEKAGKPLEDVIALAQWGVALAGRGHYAQGLAQAEHSLSRVKAMGFGYGVEVNQVVIAWIHFLGGDMIQSLQAAFAAVQLAQAAGDWIQVFTSSVFIAWAQSRLGQSSAALATVAQIELLAQKSNMQLVGAEMFMAARAEIGWNAAQIEQAVALAEQAVAAAQANDALFSQGIAHRVWALALAASAASWEEIESHFSSSLAAFEQGDARLEMARTRVAWGTLLAERHRRPEARAHFEMAVAQFESSGLARELEETRPRIEALAK